MGMKGEPGDDGAQGAVGQKGEPGDDGADGDRGIYVANIYVPLH